MGHCIVLLDKTIYSHSASLHPGVQEGTFKPAGIPAMDLHPIQFEVAIFLVTSCY